MSPPAFLLSTASSQVTKPNTRIPPILAAGKASKLNPAASTTTTTTTTTAEPSFSRLATLSKQRLSAEAASGDPDLRRCLGHHGLLTRSLYKAKEDMKRYLEEVLESESEDDDIQGGYEFGKGEVLFQEDEFADDEYDEDDEDNEDEEDECPTVEEAAAVLSPTAAPVAPAPAPAAIPKVQLPAPAPAQVPPPAPAPRSVPCSTSTPGPVWMKEKIVGAVRGVVRRRNATRLRPSPGPSPPAPPLSTTSPSTSPSQNEPQSTLTQMAAKNASCSQVPVYIDIHEHLSKPARTLERSQSQSQLQSQTQGQGRSITMRGRQYAQRLGLKVAAAVPVTT
ncbi:hypothetical protein BDV10DRAFT_159623 [Aspergillus recurvatus]